MSVTEIEAQYQNIPGDIWEHSSAFEALQMLTPEERSLIIMLAEVGSGRELAEIYGIPRETVRRRINKALGKLRDILKQT